MDYIVKKIDNKKASQIIKLNHYSHTWSSCKYALGLYRDGLILGVAAYGWPVGRNAALSISPRVNEKEVMELTRLWVSDSEGKNTESWFLGKTFTWFKQHDRTVKVLISYSDPNAGHAGIIYQATNWIYQGRNSDNKWYLINGELVHPRTVHTKYGTRAMDELKKLDSIASVDFVEVETKHRYIYVLAGKKERTKIIDSLYRPPLKYDRTSYFAGLYNKSKTNIFFDE